MRLYIFGGSFNPPHRGHSQLLEFLLQQEKPDLLLVLPVAHPPHKVTTHLLPFTARLYLTRLQLNSLLKKYRHNLKISRLENHLPPPNYTLRTIEQLRLCFPQAKITLILGADAFASLPQWHQPEKLAAQVEFLVLQRSGAMLAQLPKNFAFRSCENPLWEVSSSLIREWLQDYYLAREQHDGYLQEWVASLLRDKLGSTVFEAIVQHGWYYEAKSIY